MEKQENNNGQFQIELKEEVAQGIYANLAIIAHSASGNDISQLTATN